MSEHIFDVIVIGGGPSGMMAAGCAGELGTSVLLLEKNRRLGKKLSITGGGRCNVTNAEFNTRVFLENFLQAKQFLYSPFSQFDVQSTFDFFEGRGLPLMVEDRKRAFPKSEQAEDVCKVMEQYVRASGNVTVKLNEEVATIDLSKDDLVEVGTKRGRYMANRLIIATGGLAAPETGSTGEALSMLEQLGHTVKQPNPNLTPLRTSAQWVHELSGLTLESMKLRYIQAGKIVWAKTGRLLFTHFGISGPIVLNSAYEVSEFLQNGRLTASIDLFPDLNEKELDDSLLALFNEHKNKLVKNVLPILIPSRIAETVCKRSQQGIADTPVHSLSKDDRKWLVKLMKDLSFEITGTMGYDWSIVADGGVVPEEIDFRSMQSRVDDRLYLIGDIININRPSGGFSLQLCWTMGWVAGAHVATTVK